MVMVIIPIERNCRLTYVKVPIPYNCNGKQLERIGTIMGEVGSLTFNGASILWLAGTVMGEVGAHNRGACPLDKRPGQLVR